MVAMDTRLLVGDMEARLPVGDRDSRLLVGESDARGVGLDSKLLPRKLRFMGGFSKAVVAARDCLLLDGDMDTLLADGDSEARGEALGLRDVDVRSWLSRVTYGPEDLGSRTDMREETVLRR